MILSSFAFHTALLVTTLATTTPHATAAKSIKSLSKSSSPSMVPSEVKTKTQQQQHSKDFYEILRGTQHDPASASMMQNDPTYSFLSSTVELLSTLCDRVIAAATVTWKRMRKVADDLLLTTALLLSPQDSITKPISTWTFVYRYHNLTSSHWASYRVRALLAQILPPPAPPPPLEQFAFVKTKINIKAIYLPVWHLC